MSLKDSDNQIVPFLVSLAIYSALFLVEWNIANGVMQAHRLIFGSAFFLAWSLTFVLVKKPITAIVSSLGCSLGVLLGYVIGDMLYAFEVAQLEELLKQPGYTQQYEPHHYGWLICLGTFAVVTAGGLVFDRYFAKRSLKAREVIGPSSD